MTRLIAGLFAAPVACGPLCRAVEDEVASMRRADMLAALPDCKRKR